MRRFWASSKGFVSSAVVLNVQVDVSEEQCKDIFHMRCQIRDKVCGVARVQCCSDHTPGSG
jgi:hypothetical protein